ncbi:uncharacterized protein EDB91DRAFT_1088214 [Suillus paluster]|uniref:uncharacterized protein n=1 Tax=Suillus paluster TaxID=48578 RepID=UPI001B86F498|nr:uncharacterized protein EDB91DRAFT_1088214 [Suillus paluster]KAG1722164.1 hypothetical protein EDB91DRAFT_1088214 [Suillus paluster]
MTALLRSGEDRTTQPVPLSYDKFTFEFNFNEPEILVKFTTVGTDDVVKINGPAVTTEFLVGDDKVQPTIIQPTTTTPRDPEGGRWLNKRKAELIDDTLWDNLERSHRQNLRHDEAIKAQKSKRQYLDSPQPPSSPAPAIPCPPKSNVSGSKVGPSRAPAQKETNQTDDMRMGGAEDDYNNEVAREVGRVNKKDKGVVGRK